VRNSRWTLYLVVTGYVALLLVAGRWLLRPAPPEESQLVDLALEDPDGRVVVRRCGVHVVVQGLRVYVVHPDNRREKFEGYYPVLSQRDPDCAPLDWRTHESPRGKDAAAR